MHQPEVRAKQECQAALPLVFSLMMMFSSLVLLRWVQPLGTVSAQVPGSRDVVHDVLQFQARSFGQLISPCDPGSVSYHSGSHSCQARPYAQEPWGAKKRHCVGAWRAERQE